MKNQFHVFYENNIVDFTRLDSSTLIVLDANVLLHFFRYSNASREKLLKALKKIKSNIFIPYQASLEYHFSRQSVERSHDKNVDDLINKIDEAKEEFMATIKESIDSYGRNIRSTDEIKIREEVIKELMAQFDEFMDSFKNKTLIKETGLVTKNEQLSYEISNILTGKVGEKFSAEEITLIQEDGEKRYLKKIPPGYKDDSKDNMFRIFGEYEYKQKFGDLILWKEIIKYCKEHKEIKKVFLISDDAKDDWLFKAKGETVGIKVELKQELFEESGAAIDLLDTNKLLNEVLNSQVDIVKEYENVNSSYLNKLLNSRNSSYVVNTDKKIQTKHNFSSKNYFLENSSFQSTNDLLMEIKYIRMHSLESELKYMFLINKLVENFDSEYINAINKLILNFKSEEDSVKFLYIKETYEDYLRYKKDVNTDPAKVVRIVERIVDMLEDY